MCVGYILKLLPLVNNKNYLFNFLIFVYIYLFIYLFSFSLTVFEEIVGICARYLVP